MNIQFNFILSYNLPRNITEREMVKMRRELDLTSRHASIKASKNKRQNNFHCLVLLN